MVKKHICFVTKYYGIPKNGPSTFADSFIKNIMKTNRYIVTVISGESAESKFGETIVTYTPYSHLYDGLSIRNLIKEINLTKPIDVLYFNCFRNAIYSFNLGIPYYVNINDHHTYIKPRNYIWKLLSYQVLQKANKNFVNSTFTLNKVLAYHNLNKNKFLVTGKGIDLKDFQFVYNEVKDTVNILFIGSQFHRKGLDIALKALRILKNKLPHEIKLHIVGESGDDIKKYDEMVDEYALQNYVVFLGRQGKDEIVRLHNKAHFFILPSREEAFGVSIIEALASGSTVIASNTGGIPTIINDKVNGYLINVEDFEDLARKIINLIENRDLRKKITIKGLDDSENFSFKKVFNKIIQHL